MARARVTIREVAEASGVSIQTVSNLVNGRTNQMSAGTERRIRRVMKDLGYHPNPAARGLRSARTRTLGFLILDDATRFLADPMTDLFLAGFADVSREEGHAVLIQASRPGSPIENLFLPLYERRIDGAVVSLSGPGSLRAEYVARLHGQAVPFVLLEEHSDVGNGTPLVAADDRAGSRELCRHLLARGHSRIAFLTAAQRWSAIEERHAGYLEALAEAGIDPDPALVSWHGNFAPLDAADGAGMLLDLDPRPTAIMCGNDLIALGALRAARRRGLEVPRDVAVTGFDDFEFAEAIEPALTTVRIAGYEMGEYAANVLIESITEKGAPEGRVFRTQLCIRDSA
jgi:DNA-binding LacI/PurR family transcriptional regulator